MAHHFTFQVTVTLERTQGKFVSRDEMTDEIADALDQANPDSLTLGDDGEYDVVDWDVMEVVPVKAKKAEAHR